MRIFNLAPQFISNYIHTHTHTHTRTVYNIHCTQHPLR